VRTGRAGEARVGASTAHYSASAVRAHDALANWAAAARDLGNHRSNLHHRAQRLGLKGA